MGKANKLRGPMDASEYKNYILPFYVLSLSIRGNQDEYLSDNYLEEFYEVTDPEEKKSISRIFPRNRLCDRSRVCLNKMVS